MSAAPQLKEGLKYSIKAQKGPVAGQTFKFETAILQIGRGNENGLILSNDLRASRLHAEIRWDGFELHVYNLSKKNFLIVNGIKVESAKLDSGSVIVIGDSELKIEFDQESKTQLVAVDPAPAEPVASIPPAQDMTPLQHNEVSVEMRSTPILQPMSAKPMPAPVYKKPVANNAAAGWQGTYGNSSAAAQTARPRPIPATKGANSGRIRFYAIILIAGIGFWWLMSSNGAKKKELSFRSTEQIEQDIEASKEEIKVFEARKEKMDSVQYKRAQENYIRGFRDYRQGNYGRARESFQVVLNLDPDNELAKRYYHLSKVKFDELVKFNMLQGNRYRDKKNWRMCKSSYFSVMTMLNNNQDPIFKEAKQYYNQCTLAEEGRF